jgi:D-glycero-alpha-D-manno-heptose-7-phosphate kinase
VIIVRTPTRISFFGGGTDYPSWFEQHGGAVISATINKYSYITARTLPPFFPFNHRIRYYEQEEVDKISEIRHPSVRECARFLNFGERLEVVHNADLPARSGLGSSSTFTVGMLHALHALQGNMTTKRELASEAIHVEQELIGEAVGSQDQVAAAFGGLNHITFSRSGFEVAPITVSAERREHLLSHLLLCFTGFARTASEIAVDQIARTADNSVVLAQVADFTRAGIDLFGSQDFSMEEFGELLTLQWQAKRRLSPLITTAELDEIVERGITAGALGAKLLGAGGGGFLLFVADPSRHGAIRAALGEKMFVPFRFESTGSSVVYYSHD